MAIYPFLFVLPDLRIHSLCDPSSCKHGSPPRPHSLKNFHEGTIIIAGVSFPEGFFYAVRKFAPHRSLVGYNCDAVVDLRTKRIVAVFLSPDEHKLFGIYRGEGGMRVELTKLSIDGDHFAYVDQEGEALYPEFVEFNKPQKMYKNILHRFLL